MAGFYGADVGQLRQLGRELAQQAERLDGIISRLGPRIEDVPWQGPDAQRFRSEWTSRLVVSLRAAVRILHEASGQAVSDANQQEQASGGSAVGLGPWPTQIFPLRPIPDSVVPRPDLRAPGDLERTEIESPRLDMVFWESTREALRTNIPGTPWGYGEIGSFIPGADTVLTVRDIADSLQQGEVPVHEMVDAAAGALRKTGPLGYGVGLAGGLWNTAIQEAGKVDWSPQATASTWDFIVSNPGDAWNAAAGAVVDGLPKIIKNFKFW